MRLVSGSAVFLAIAAVVVTACAGCGMCPLAQFDTDGDGTLSSEEVAPNVDAVAAAVTQVVADPIDYLLCATYLSYEQ